MITDNNKVEELINLFKKESYNKDLNKAKTLKKKEMLNFIENPEWTKNPNDKGWRPEGSELMCFLYEPESKYLPFAVFCDSGFYKIEFTSEYPYGNGILLAEY